MENIFSYIVTTLCNKIRCRTLYLKKLTIIIHPHSTDELQEQFDTKVGEYIQTIDELEQDFSSKKNECDSLQKQLNQLNEKLSATG